MSILTISEKREQNAQKYKDHYYSLKKKDPEGAKEYAVSELIRMGLFSSDGKPKQKIVTESHLYCSGEG